MKVWLKLSIPFVIPKFLGIYILKRHGYVQCRYCKEFVNYGEYCESCGQKLGVQVSMATQINVDTKSAETSLQRLKSDVRKARQRYAKD